MGKVNHIFFITLVGSVFWCAGSFESLLEFKTTIAAERTKDGNNCSDLTEITVSTGSSLGTYSQLARDMEKFLRDECIDLNIRPTSGIEESIDDVYRHPNVELGIVQSDLLGSISKKYNVEKLKKVASLDDARMHVLATDNIKTWSELAGKSIYIGRADSGTYYTARVLLKATGIIDKVRLYGEKTDSDEVLLDLAYSKGYVDAVFLNASVPNERIEKALRRNPNLHLISIPKYFDRRYMRSSIHKDTYPNQTRAVATVSTETILITYDWNSIEHSEMEKYKYICDAVNLINHTIEAEFVNINSNQNDNYLQISDCVDSL